MSSDKFGEIIRTEKDKFKTPNIYAYKGNGEVEVHLENFRQNKQDTEFVLFFSWQNELYFPIWFEFRSINNNLLYLFKEFGVDSFSMLARILNSSLEKEEFYTATIKALVYHTKKEPHFCVKLGHFQMEDQDKVDVFE